MAVKRLAPAGAITPTGPWSLGARAGDFVFVAGMRGIDPATNTIVGSEEERIRRAYTNMKTIAESEGATLGDCVRLTVFVTDMKRLRPLVNKVQEELWAGGPYPPRTIVEVARLNQDDIFEVEGTFLRPENGLIFCHSGVVGDAVTFVTYIGIVAAAGSAALKDETPWASRNSSTTK